MCNLVRLPSRADIDANLIAINRLIGIQHTQLPLFEEDPPRMVVSQGRPFLPILTKEGWLTASWMFAPPPADPKDKTQGWRMQTGNARAEEMFEKATYKKAAPTNRCALPVVAYYEHQHRGTVKVPYAFHFPDNRIFWLLGIYQKGTDGVTRFSICTMEPNALNRWIHNSQPRQPVKSPEERLTQWLAGGGPDSVAPFLVPDDADGLVAERTFGITGKWLDNPPPAPEGRPAGVLEQGQGELF
jgi:putative SOS response-associated peptidase YedK